MARFRVLLSTINARTTRVQNLAFTGIFLIIYLLSARVYAQNLADMEQGIKPYGAYEGGNIDSVSMVNGDLTLHIPIISYPQRGGALKVGFVLNYAAPFYTDTDNCYNNPLPNCIPVKFTYHLSYGAPYPGANGTPIGFGPDFGKSVAVHYFNGNRFGFEIGDADGAIHLVNNTPSADATGYAYSYNPSLGNYGTGIITDRLGIRYYIPYQNSSIGPIPGASPGTIEDANGNILTPNYDQSGVTSWTDSMGRILPTRMTSTTDYSGCSGSLPISSASLWNPPGLNGGVSEFKFCYAVDGILYTPPGCGTNCKGINTSKTVLQSVVLPNGTAWSFTYDTRGLLTKITLPTGGSITYTWNLNTGSPGCIVTTGDDLPGYIASVASRTVDANDGTGGHTWNYALTWPQGKSQMIVTDPYLNDTVHTESFLAGCSAYETGLDQYNGSHTSGTLLRRTTTTYQFTTSTSYPQAAVGAVPTSITTTDMQTGNSSQVAMTYDSGVNGIIYGNLLTKKDYDFGGALLRNTIYTYQAFSGPNASSYLANNLISLPYTVQIKNGAGAQVSLTQYNYDETAPVSSGLSNQFDPAPPTGTFRGNNTSIRHWLNTGTFSCPNGHSGGSGGYLISNKTYFNDGMTNTSADPCGDTTTYAYSLSYWGTLPTTITNALNQSTTNVYDFNTGLLTSTTDPNHQTTSYSYDSTWRLAQVNYPDNGQDTITHQETTFPFSATLTSKIDPSKNKITTNIFDGLGRVKQSQLYDPDEGTIYIDTTYDALGRVHTHSNPYRGTPSSTDGTTTYNYDVFNRTISVVNPDNSTVTTNYATDTGLMVTTTDEAGNQRRSWTDALGRMTQVNEPGGNPASLATPKRTFYTYDALENLTYVEQRGETADSNQWRTRNFTYDSLSRLVAAANPESGTINYNYDPNGNVLTRTDARGIVTTYHYDPLDRITEKDYSDGSTPSVFFAYDSPSSWGATQTNIIGRLEEEWTGTSCCDTTAEIYSYDQMSRITLNTQFTPNMGYHSVSYSYNLAGALASATNGEGVTIGYNYDGMGRPTIVTSSLIDSQHPATLFTVDPSVGYFPSGQLRKGSYGNGLVQSNVYNNRLQPCLLNVNSSNVTLQTCNDNTPSGNILDLWIGYGTTNNNGNVLNWNATGAQSFVRTYAYDGLNRLQSLNSTGSGGSFSWTYDNWGNRTAQTLTGGTGYSWSSLVDTRNRLLGSPYTYDAAGNLLTDGNHTYTYDAENRIATVDGGTTASYVYNADGSRVEKLTGNWLDYIHDLNGNTVAEVNANGWATGYIYLAGSLLAQYDNSTTHFIHHDHLGSTRLVTAISAVTVRFTNDSCSGCGGTPVGGGDRNLFVNSISIGATTIPQRLFCLVY
jgi:YD repeat-containing protein